MEKALRKIRYGLISGGMAIKHPSTLAWFIMFENEYIKAAEEDLADVGRDITIECYYGPDAPTKASELIRRTSDIYILDFDECGAPDFSEYDGETTIIIEDFSAQCTQTALFLLFSGQKTPIYTKFGKKYAKYTQIYITSSQHPADWYQPTGGRDPNEIINKFNKIALCAPQILNVSQELDALDAAFDTADSSK